MIVNVRGTNGSGKSTVVQEFMALGQRVPVYGILGTRYPEAYRCIFPKGLVVYALGPYHIPTGGCDNFGTDEALLTVLGRYVPRGNVLFEGCRISDHWGKVGEFFDSHAADVTFAFLSTPLEECIRRVAARRKEVGNHAPFDPKKTMSRWRDVERWRKRLEVKFKTVCLSDGHGAQDLLELFK